MWVGGNTLSCVGSMPASQMYESCLIQMWDQYFFNFNFPLFNSLVPLYEKHKAAILKIPARRSSVTPIVLYTNPI